MHIHSFSFGPFQVNTFVVWDAQLEAAIIDPGCWTPEEKLSLRNFIQEKNLRVTQLLNTHCHLDHIEGNLFVAETYGVKPSFHALDRPIFDNQENSGKRFGIPVTPSPEPDTYLKENETVFIGNEALEVLLCPGHSPGHIVFYNAKDKWVINGDVLFRESIGRTDLYLGDHATLLQNIQEVMFALPDDTVVFTGHGPETSIGWEKKYNPFVGERALTR